MNFFIDNWTLFAIAIVSASMLLWPVVSKGALAGGVGANEAVMLMNREKAVVVDVCEPLNTRMAMLRAQKHPFEPVEAKLTGAVKTRPPRPFCAPAASAPTAPWPLPPTGLRKSGFTVWRHGCWREASLPVEKADICLRTILHPFTTAPRPHLMQPVKIYLTATCPYCIRAKQLLADRGVTQLEEVRVDIRPELRQHMAELTGRTSVPQIFIGNTHVGGCDDLHALDARGGLLPLLNA